MKKFFRYIEDNFFYLFAALGLGASVFFLMSNTQASMFYLIFANIFYIYAQLEDFRNKSIRLHTHLINEQNDFIEKMKRENEKNINCLVPPVQFNNP